MTIQQTFETIPVDLLLERVRAMHDRGYRLAQIGATRLPDAVEVLYSFAAEQELANLRVQLSASDPRVPSVSSIYSCVVLYENEMHDLFKIKVEGMAVDFRGNLYRTTVKFPFGTVKAPVVKPAPAAEAPAKPAQVTTPAAAK